MKSKILFRIASGLLIFHLFGHTMGHLGWKKAEEPVKQEVIRQMTEHKFPFMGAVKSMGDYYEGYGWASSIALIFFALVLWFISNSIQENKILIYKITITLSICLVLWGILELIFFFAFAASITFLAAIATIYGVFKLKDS